MSTQLLLVALFVASMLLMFWNYKRKRKKIIFFGDSITAYGAANGGFIRLIEKNFSLEGLRHKYELVTAGVSGNKIYDLLARLEHDVLVNDPRIVVIYIGVNDVWHKQKRGTGTDIETFENIYQAIISKLKEVHAKMILVTPAAIGERPFGENSQDFDLALFCEVIQRLAEKNNIPMVDLRTAFIHYNLQYNVNGLSEGVLTTDGVHLNAMGNMVVAEEIWKVMEPLVVN